MASIEIPDGATGALALALAGVPQASAKPSKRRLTKAIAGDHRDPKNVARDPSRNPLETLTALGVERNMTVVELWPGAGGYYTEILAPYLRKKGELHVATFDRSATAGFAVRSNQLLQEKMDARPDVFDQVKLTDLVRSGRDMVPTGAADMVLSFRNIHNWMAGEYQDAVMQSVFRALKPGGYFGVVEHRGNPDVPQDPKARSGYVNEATMMDLAARNGFAFVSKSDVNANPKDRKDYPQGVWALPPTFRKGDTDKDEMAAIGESDRFTMLFQKPKT